MDLTTTSSGRVSTGWKTFLTIWSGQVVSLLGSGLSGFALGLWVLRSTGSVTRFALIAACTLAPRILLSPLTGTLADRWDRRWTMLTSEMVAAAATLYMAVMMAFGHLGAWQIYVAMSVISVCTAFQWPAYAASITLLVPKDQFGRASGMVQIGQGLAQTLAPVMAGAMMQSSVGIVGILVVDLCSYLFAATTLGVVHIPRLLPGAHEDQDHPSLVQDIAYGWRYLATRPGLVGLLVMVSACNFLLGAIMILVNPLVLSFSSPQVLGTVMTTAGVGMFVGSAVMSVSGGPRRRVRGMVGFLVLGGAALLPAALPPSPLLIASGAFLFLLAVPIASGCMQAILQGKVHPAVQGRVFAFTGMAASAAMPVAYLVSGPLADRFLEPWFAVGGPLAGSLGRWIGVGPGRGVAAAFVASGLLLIAVTVAGYLHPRVRGLEDELPDAIPDAEPAARFLDLEMAHGGAD
jgi:DHA3 family macrolide efflux protein-like MFS transporter